MSLLTVMYHIQGCFSHTTVLQRVISQYPFLAGCISRYSAGSIYHYPSYHHQHNPSQVECFQKDLKRYLTRKIGFEAVMRIRCTKGQMTQSQTWTMFYISDNVVQPSSHCSGSMQVCPSTRSTGTSLCAPRICCPCPTWTQTQASPFRCPSKKTWTTCRSSHSRRLCFIHPVKVHRGRRLGLLICLKHLECVWLHVDLSSVGERRIRVHTLCLPVVNSLSDIFAGADVQAMTGLLACMGAYQLVLLRFHCPFKKATSNPVGIIFIIYDRRSLWTRWKLQWKGIFLCLHAGDSEIWNICQWQNCYCLWFILYVWQFVLLSDCQNPLKHCIPITLMSQSLLGFRPLHC